MQVLLPPRAKSISLPVHSCGELRGRLQSFLRNSGKLSLLLHLKDPPLVLSMKGIFVHIIELVYCLVELRLSFWNCAFLWSCIAFKWVEFAVIVGLLIAIFRISQLNLIRIYSFMWLVKLRRNGSIVVGRLRCTTLPLRRLLDKKIAAWIWLHRYWQLDFLFLTFSNSRKDLWFVSGAADARSWGRWEVRALHELHRRT